MFSGLPFGVKVFEMVLVSESVLLLGGAVYKVWLKLSQNSLGISMVSSSASQGRRP